MLPQQEKVAKFYNSGPCQVGVAILIGANFLTNIVEKEIDAHGDKYESEFGAFELFYNICFTIELGFNMYAHWSRPFWQSNWNIFDVVVVTIGVVNTMELPLPPAFSMLRMMRAFRVFRLFKRVRSLNKIIVAIMHAVPGVMNAFLILAIIMSIYAILAVEFYYELGDDCKEIGGDSRFLTIRGNCAGQEYFGTFTKSFYSFFQVLTGESWSEAVARPAIWFYSDDPIRAVGGGLFFVSYVLVTAFVLTNVVVAVLLDKMVDPEVAEGADQEHPEYENIRASRILSSQQNDDENSTMPEVQVCSNPTTTDLRDSMASVDAEVEKLLACSETMGTDVSILRNDMASVRDQVANVMQYVPMKIA